MAGDNDETDNPFEGFVDHTDAKNVLHPADVAEADDNDDNADDADDGGSEEGQANDTDDNDDEDEGTAGEEGSEDDDDDDDSDDDGDGDGSGDEDGDDDDDDGAEDGAAEDGDPSPKKKKRGPQHRINQAVKKQRTAERRAEAAEARAEAAEAKNGKELTDDGAGGTGEEADGSAELQKPDVTDTKKYPYGELDSNYQEDLTQYRVDKTLAARDQKREAKEQETAAEEAKEAWNTKYEDKVAEGIEAYEDFDEIVVKGADNSEFPLTPETAMMALDSPVGHHVLYEIATKPKLAKKMAQMSLVEQAKQFGRLEARYETTKKPKSKHKIVPNTRPPASRRKGGGGTKKFDAKVGSFEDFEKQVNADQQRRNRK